MAFLLPCQVTLADRVVPVRKATLQIAIGLFHWRGDEHKYTRVQGKALPLDVSRLADDEEVQAAMMEHLFPSGKSCRPVQKVTFSHKNTLISKDNVPAYFLDLFAVSICPNLLTSLVLYMLLSILQPIISNI